MHDHHSSALDAWLEEYNDNPYRTYRRILIEQPENPRDVSYNELVKAQYGSIDIRIVTGFGIVQILIAAFISSTVITGRATTSNDILMAMFLVGGLFFLVLPFLIALRMERILRNGALAEARVLRTRWRQRLLYGDVLVYKGEDVWETECVLSPIGSWQTSISPDHYMGVLLNPKTNRPALFLRVTRYPEPDKPSLVRKLFTNIISRRKR